MFKELEQELLQQDISTESAELIYRSYFQKFTELATLKHMGCYQCRIKKPTDDEPVDTLFVFGRTRTTPYTYYYQTCYRPADPHPDWQPWDKIDSVINADCITPAYCFDKLIVFWVEPQEKQSRDSQNNKVTEYQFTINFIYQEMNGLWSAPQTLLDKEIMGNVLEHSNLREEYKRVGVIASKTLQDNRQYRDAQQWYHYLFNLTEREGSWWQFLPFQEVGASSLKDSLTDTLTNEVAIQTYNEEPFSPHAIASLRGTAYQKNVVMSYIDNLLDWGDTCFARDTWESIAEATMLYFTAWNVMGPKPESIGQWPIPEARNFDDISTANEGNVPQFLIELENLDELPALDHLPPTPFNDLPAYFGVSENKDLAAYWEKVEDRMFKIRHSMNIEGIRRLLSLFEPEIDPMLLVRAVANGQTPMQAMDLMNAEILPYRFDYLLERTKSLTSTVVQLGGTLLSAIEKQDAEEIVMICASHEKAVLQLVTSVKQNQIEEAQTSLDALQQSRKAAEIRRDHYQGLIENGWIREERISFQFTTESQTIYENTQAVRTAVGAARTAPNVKRWNGLGSHR